jgi:hypothetical protein
MPERELAIAELCSLLDYDALVQNDKLAHQVPAGTPDDAQEIR